MKLRIRPENTMDTVEHSLMRMFRDGPEVSFVFSGLIVTFNLMNLL